MISVVRSNIWRRNILWDRFMYCLSHILWVMFEDICVSSIDKIFFCRIINLGFESFLHQNQLVSWPDNKKQLSWGECHKLIFYGISKLKKKKVPLKIIFSSEKSDTSAFYFPRIPSHLFRSVQYLSPFLFLQPSSFESWYEERRFYITEKQNAVELQVGNAVLL